MLLFGGSLLLLWQTSDNFIDHREHDGTKKVKRNFPCMNWRVIVIVRVRVSVIIII